jgi:hypothetical protein
VIETPLGATGPEAGRDGRGRFITANTVALVTGERSRAFWMAAEGQRRETRQALLQQRGHTEADAPPALVLLCDGAAQACLVRDGAFNRLVESGGPTTTRGRHRAIVKTWESASDRAMKHLQAIGLDAHESDEPFNLNAWIDAKLAAQEAAGEATDDGNDQTIGRE